MNKGLQIETKNRRGFIILVLVIGIAIMFVLYAMYSGTLNPFSAFEGTQADRYSDPNAYPWQEEHLFIKEELDGYGMGGRRPPFRDQPNIKNTLKYIAEVYDGDEQRGEIELTIFRDGDAWAIWIGDFIISGKHYLAEVDQNSGSMTPNKFRGNIAPLKIYEDEKGKDKSKLYVITRGFFELYGAKENDQLGGIAYVTAWLDKNYNAKGQLAIPLFVNGRTAIFDWGPVRPQN